MADFTATSRVPTRPLSYANKDLAYRKELLVDYTNGMIYVNDENGIIHNVSDLVYTQLIEKGEIVDNIQIVIPDSSGGTSEVTIQNAFSEVFSDIDVINSNIGSINEIIKELTGDSGTLEIDPSTIIQDATHRFLTDTQINNLKEKVTIVEQIITIDPSEIIGSEAPYNCVKSVVGVHPDYPAPTIDISYTDDIFENNEKEEDAWYCIHRCQILAADEATFTFKKLPETAFRVLFQIKVPGID